MFTLKDIDEAVVEKKFWKGKIHVKQAETQKERFAFNDGIEAQSSVRLRLNRDKLEDIIRDAGLDSILLAEQDIELLTDAIIAADKEIIEVVK